MPRKILVVHGGNDIGISSKCSSKFVNMIPVTETSVKDVIFFVHQIFILCIFRIRSEDNKSELRGFNRFQNDNLEFLKFFGRWDRKILWPRKQDLTNKLQHISFTLIFFYFIEEVLVWSLGILFLWLNFLWHDLIFSYTQVSELWKDPYVLHLPIHTSALPIPAVVLQNVTNESFLVCN